MELKARLFSHSFVIFGARVAGAGIIVVAQAGIARLWGGAVLGEYLLIIAVVNLVAMFMPLGFNTVGTYFAAEYRARGRRDMLWRFLFRAYLHVVLAGLGVWVVALSLTGVFGVGFSDYSQSYLLGIARYWMPASILAAATAIVFVNGAVLVGLKHPFAGFLADGLFRPMLVIGALGVAALAADQGRQLETLLWILALGYFVVALAHLGFVFRAMKTVPDSGQTGDAPTGAGEVARWWRFAMPWVLIGVATSFFFDIDLILLSGLMDKETLAVFGVSTRIFSLLAFGVTAVYALALPDMFEAAADKKTGEFVRRIGDTNLVATGLSLVMFGAILIGGPLILTLFGPAFASGAIPLAILSLVLVVRSVLGPADLVLSIHERPWAALPAVVCGMAILVVANIILVPWMGLLGAALGALGAFIGWSVVLWATARRIAKIDVSIFPVIARWRRASAV